MRLRTKKEERAESTGEEAPEIPAIHSIPKGCRERFLSLQARAAMPLLEAGVIQAGLSSVVAGYEMSRPRAGWHLVLLTTAGAGFLETPPGPVKLAPGDLLLAPAQSAYRYRVHGRRWELAWLHFRNPCPAFPLRGREIRIVRAGWGAELVASMEASLRESKRRDGAAFDAALLHHRLLLNALGREMAGLGAQEADEKRRSFDALWEAVMVDPASPWTVQRLAERAGLSTTHFRRLAAAMYGKSPQRLVAELRMLRAQEMLKTRGIRLREIAARVGYQSEFSFSTAFRRVFGMAPDAWRRGFPGSPQG
ncbi:MAG: helix-turn-helix transcriptional regulator [Spirochaetes bacterium]|nr:helix-turn-helix transcriptional regulator [Spirochaetota bacterium]